MIKDDLVVIETDRLLIRKFEKTDFRNFLSIHEDPIIMKYFDGGAKTLDQSRKRFSEILEHQSRYGFSYYNIFLKDTGQYIGQGGLYYNYDMTVNLCYAFLPKYQGMGYATEAISAIVNYGFNKLGFNLITAMSAIENEKSRNLLARLGAKFVREKTLFSGMKVLSYDIIKEDFSAAMEKIKHNKYRKAVGVILRNKLGQIYIFQRNDFPENWQCPEGGIDEGETALEAAYREVAEEVGVNKNNIKPVAETKCFYRYNFPDNRIMHEYIGQEKKFFLFDYIGDESDFGYKNIDEQEFRAFKMTNKKDIIALVPQFKKDLYLNVMNEFDKYLV